MKIEPKFTHKYRDGYEYKIDNNIILDIADTAISVLKINLPLSGYIEEYYQSIIDQLDIEKMINDLLNKDNKISEVTIDSVVCRIDGKIVFHTDILKKYKKIHKKCADKENVQEQEIIYQNYCDKCGLLHDECLCHIYLKNK